MFCKIVNTPETVRVMPTRLGRFLRWLTRGLIRPRVRFDRDFGHCSEDGRSLFVSSGCDVEVNGAAYSACPGANAIGVRNEPPDWLTGNHIGLDWGKGESMRVLTCVYCGHEYPQDTPASGDKVLTDHIRQCEKHPMKRISDENAILRKALAGLVGAESRKEFRLAMIDAIQALRHVKASPEPQQGEQG